MRDIIVLDNPILKLPTIEIAKVEANETRSPEYQAGQISPLIDFGGNYYSAQGITDFKLTYGDTLLPTIKVSIFDKGDSILVDEADISDTFIVFLRSNNPDFKPIAMEFLIEDMKRNGKQYSLTGSLFVKGIDDEIIKGYNGSSMEVCRNLAREYGLGFASNITKSDDSQKWLRTAQSFSNMLDEIELHSWANDKSAIRVWIDPYYTLNYFDFGEANDLDPDDFPMMAEVNNAINFTGDKEDEVKEFILTNHRNKNGTSSFIQGYTPINRKGSLERAIGFERVFRTEDVDINKYFEYTSKQTILQDIADRSGKNSRSTYVGFTSENTHRNYNHAVVQNEINYDIYTARGLKVSLSPINPKVHTGMILPIIIINTNQNNIDLKGGAEEDQYNGQLSGNYIAGKVQFLYKKGAFLTELECFRMRQDIK